MAATYAYKAIDAGGTMQTGLVSADAPEMVAERIRRMGLRPVAVEPGAGVVHRLVQPETVEGVAQVVVGVDVAPRSAKRFRRGRALHRQRPHQRSVGCARRQRHADLGTSVARGVAAWCSRGGGVQGVWANVPGADPRSATRYDTEL